MDSRLDVIIIDDEQRACRVLNNLLERYCPDVNVITTCSSVSDAVSAIKTFEPDAIFLDIEMPEYTGFELLKKLGEFQCDVVFVTAYNKYAVQAFDVSAIDYVLKPVSIDKLEQAVEKLKRSKDNSQISLRLKALEENMANTEDVRLVLPSRNGFDYIRQNEITHINADGSYCEIYLKDKQRFVVSKKMKFFESKLSESPWFFRCHRSHIINITAVKTYKKGEGVVLMENDLGVSISRDKKEELSRRLKRTVW